MPTTQQIQTRRGDVVVLVGTMKGAFIFRAGPDRARFEMGGPWFPGHSVYSMAYDGRGDRRRVWAAASSMHWGALLNHSDDFGATWTTPEVPTVRFPEGTKALQNIWQIAPGRADEPDVVYCGVEPAALFESRDGGKSFALVEGLWQHPHREKWQPGGGGLCLHTVLPDPSRKGRITVAISTGGVYRTDDGGGSWHPLSEGLPQRDAFETVVRDAMGTDQEERAGIYFGTRSGKLFASRDDGESWMALADGLPPIVCVRAARV